MASGFFLSDEEGFNAHYRNLRRHEWATLNISQVCSTRVVDADVLQSILVGHLTTRRYAYEHRAAGPPALRDTNALEYGKNPKDRFELFLTPLALEHRVETGASCNDTPAAKRPHEPSSPSSPPRSVRKRG
jgi:hypothetical protein